MTGNRRNDNPGQTICGPRFQRPSRDILNSIAGPDAFEKFMLLSADFVHLCQRTYFTPFQIVWIGGQVERITGYSPDDMYDIGCWLELVHPDDKTLVASHLDCLKPGTGGVLEFRMVHKNGQTRHVSESYRCEEGGSQGEFLLYGSIRDITQAKRHEEQIIKSSSAYLGILDRAPALIWRAGIDGECDWFNDTWLKFRGRGLDEEKGTGWLDGVHPQDSEYCFTTFKRHFEERTGFEMEYRLRRCDGEYRWIVDYGRPYEDLQGNFAGYIGYCHDITERKQAQDGLAKSEAKYRRLHESIMDGFVLVDMAGNIIEFNRAYQDMLGYAEDELRRLTYVDITPAKWHAFEMDIVEKQVLVRGFSEVYEKEYIRNDGTAIPVELRTYLILDVDMNPSGMWAIVRDVSERRKMLERMVQTEKMMSVGGLAAGMAHEINNPLSGILQNIQVVLRRLIENIPANAKAAEDSGFTFEALRAYLQKRQILQSLEAIKDAGNRAAQIVATMLEFSRKSERFGMADVSELLRKAIHLCSTDFDLKKKYDFRRIDIRTQFDPAIPPIPCNMIQIEQVFMNLLRNAAQAMSGEEPPPGRPAITLRTMLEGGYVRIDVEDNGPGIHESALPHIFEPFFTTKEPGVGTGLGLSVSYFIVVNNHGGLFDVESLPGRGARFVIRLPIGHTRA